MTSRPLLLAACLALLGSLLTTGCEDDGIVTGDEDNITDSVCKLKDARTGIHVTGSRPG